MVRIEILEDEDGSFHTHGYIFREIEVNFAYLHSDDPPTVGMWAALNLPETPGSTAEEALSKGLSSLGRLVLPGNY